MNADESTRGFTAELRDEIRADLDLARRLLDTVPNTPGQADADLRDRYTDWYWRVGRSVGRTIYASVDPDSDEHGWPMDDPDFLIGLMDTTELARHVVRDHNRAVAERVLGNAD